MRPPVERNQRDVCLAAVSSSPSSPRNEGPPYGSDRTLALPEFVVGNRLVLVLALWLGLSPAVAITGAGGTVPRSALVLPGPGQYPRAWWCAAGGSRYVGRTCPTPSPMWVRTLLSELARERAPDTTRVLLAELALPPSW